MPALVEVKSLPKPRRRDIYVVPMTISPQLAKKMLATGNHRDRPISKSRVDKLVAAIRRGEWCINSDCIAFDVNDNRINGQHRLTAIIEAGTPVQVLVGYNFPENAFMTTDIGAKRTSADLAVITCFGDINREPSIPGGCCPLIRR